MHQQVNCIVRCTWAKKSPPLYDSSSLLSSFPLQLNSFDASRVRERINCWLCETTRILLLPFPAHNEQRRRRGGDKMKMARIFSLSLSPHMSAKYLQLAKDVILVARRTMRHEQSLTHTSSQWTMVTVSVSECICGEDNLRLPVTSYFINECLLKHTDGVKKFASMSRKWCDVFVSQNATVVTPHGQWMSGTSHTQYSCVAVNAFFSINFYSGDKKCNRRVNQENNETVFSVNIFSRWRFSSSFFHFISTRVNQYTHMSPVNETVTRE